MTQTVLLATADQGAGFDLSRELAALGWQVAGPFQSNDRALEWLAGDDAECALVDAFMPGDAAIDLAVQLRRKGIPMVFYSGFDPRRRVIRAEFPSNPGMSRDARVPELLDAFLQVA